eukprot:2909390-Pyramimonas_sp.AAC.1
MNILGASPTTLKALLVALFRNLAGGRRPIGFFPSFSRMVSKSLAHHCRERERVSSRSRHFNMAPPTHHRLGVVNSGSSGHRRSPGQ